MTTKTIKIWLNLYRWIRNCMNFVNGANSEIVTLLTILFDLSPGKPRKRYRKILLYLKFKFSSKSWYFIGGVWIENWIYYQRIHINWMHKAQRRPLNKWVPLEIQPKNAISENLFRIGYGKNCHFGWRVSINICFDLYLLNADVFNANWCTRCMHT